MPRAKDVVEPGDAVEKSPAPVAGQSDLPPKKVVVFWKRINPFETITFTDKSTFVFGAQLYATADESLIQKISEVADRYGILIQNNGE